MMVKETASQHALLQGYIDCFLEAHHQEILKQWADNGWKISEDEEYDEACLKYISLIILDACAHKAQKVLLEKGCPAIIGAPENSYMLPAAPESLLARGLEIVREICGIHGSRGSGTLVLGIGNDILEIEVEKNKGLHVFMIKI